MSETDQQRLIQLALSTELSRIWRNTNGEAWHGWDFSIRGGRLVSGAARRISCGLGPGTSDLIGIQSVRITQEMIGQLIGVFVAIEVKAERKGLTDEQRRYIETINDLGGRAGIARNVVDADQISQGKNR